ncbi:MAG: SixA phosphatase family protein [Thermoanaerobaculia bacterium]
MRLRLRPALLALCLVLAALPAAALDTLILVRHAEKSEPWPAELDAFQPLSAAGEKRAEALAALLKSEGIAAVYTSRTTRTLATGMPLVRLTNISITAEDATTKPAEMAAFLARLRETHAKDRAVLLVGHSNTLPELLVQLGAKPACFERLGIQGEPGKLLIEGYEGIWKLDLKIEGCDAIVRQVAGP